MEEKILSFEEAQKFLKEISEREKNEKDESEKKIVIKKKRDE